MREGSVHNRTPIRLRFDARLPSVTATERWRERGRLKRKRVTVEFALALVLLVGAALLVRSFWRVQRVEPGLTRPRC